MPAKNAKPTKTVEPKMTGDQPTLSQALYIPFYYTTKDGDWGFNNIILRGVVTLRTENDIVGAIMLIKKEHPDYEVINILNWKELDN